MSSGLDSTQDIADNVAEAEVPQAEVPEAEASPDDTAAAEVPATEVPDAEVSEAEVAAADVAGVDAPRSDGSIVDDQAPEAEESAAAGQIADESIVEDEGAPTLDLVDPDRLRAAVEAVLLVVDQPIDATTLAQTLSVPQPDVEGALHGLRTEYDEGRRGMDLREIAGGWRLYSRDDFAAYVERFVLDGQQTRMTQAALETLAVIAYRQPVTRSRVSAIRGVGVDAVMRTLTTRALIEECGTDPETSGGLYRTTPLFLEKLGLNSLDQLPPLAPLLPDHTDLDPAITDD